MQTLLSYRVECFQPIRGLGCSSRQCPELWDQGGTQTRVPYPQSTLGTGGAFLILGAAAGRGHRAETSLSDRPMESRGALLDRDTPLRGDMLGTDGCHGGGSTW